MDAERAADVRSVDLHSERLICSVEAGSRDVIASEGLRLFDSLRESVNGCSVRRKSIRRKKRWMLVDLQYEYGSGRFTRGHDWSTNVAIYNIYRMG